MRSTEACRISPRRGSLLPHGPSTRPKRQALLPEAARATRDSRSYRTSRCIPGSQEAKGQESWSVSDVEITFVRYQVADQRKTDRDAQMSTIRAGSLFASVIDARPHRAGQRNREFPESHRRSHLSIDQSPAVGFKTEQNLAHSASLPEQRSRPFFLNSS